MRFHQCDFGSHTCCLYLQSGLAGQQNTLLYISLNYNSILSYQTMLNNPNHILPKTICRRKRFYLSISFCLRTVPIDSSKGKYEVVELFAAI